MNIEGGRESYEHDSIHNLVQICKSEKEEFRSDLYMTIIEITFSML